MRPLRANFDFISPMWEPIFMAGSGLREFARLMNLRRGRWSDPFRRRANVMEKNRMATESITLPNRRTARGRPRRVLDMARIRRLRDEGKTLNEIAARMDCGRGTVVRALEKMPAGPEPPLALKMAMRERASELAQSREHSAQAAEERLRLREHARHLVYRRHGDGMEVEGEPFQPSEPWKKGPGWAGIALIVGGLFLWAMGCPIPL